MTATAQILGALTVERIHELARDAGLVARGRRKEQLIESVLAPGRLGLRSLLSRLTRDELRAACRALELSDEGRSRQLLMQRLLTERGDAQSAPPPPLFGAGLQSPNVPGAGDTVRARHRQWLVDEVRPPPRPGDATWVRLTCLDDDNRGVSQELLWELELGARVIRPEAPTTREATALDEPRHFGAYLNTLRWQGVTAADRDFFQSPFRAGIEVLDHQLTPLAKALSLPRANLFIADDVGLGKTIEAGLVLQELLLRQRVEFALIVCPASVTLQWQREMEQRFGLRFENYTRDFVRQRRTERGFGQLLWATGSRFIISYPLLRRPEYREPLLAHLDTLRGDGLRAKKSLLILDEAHIAAPASARAYAVDSQITHVVRDVAPRFENRLFLSATPHNGHSNSFSALLEILDPQRFERGVPIEGPEALDDVMVRRLKRDLRALGKGMRFPERKVVRVVLSNSSGEWAAAIGDAAPAGLGGTEGPDELDLARDLAEYTALFGELAPEHRLPLINLQKRLLSSVDAFHRTLGAHASSGYTATALRPTDEADAERSEGLDEALREEQAALEVAAASGEVHAQAEVAGVAESARALLDRMEQRASELRHEPCAKARALFGWLERELGASDDPDAGWVPRRVIIFTEYADTLHYLRKQLAHHYGQGVVDRRVIVMHGGMGDERREEVQFAFNADPAEEPARILLATDAAREGLNLQAHCADLFHFDIPWNPARMEQRNGRIDRALQPAPAVRCHYFVYEDRPEDRVLEKLVQKTEVIATELGSLGAVVAERVARSLQGGIRADSAAMLDEATEEGDRIAVARRELEEGARRQQDREMARARQLYERSRKRLRFASGQLRDAVDVGLELAGASPLQPRDAGQYRLPELGPEWRETLDRLRPPLRRGQSFGSWRAEPPRPVVFEAPRVLTEGVVHLHLEHPFVQRVLSRFTAQGFGSHDLNRVSAVAIPREVSGETRVLALGRLCLFGEGAGRLHDTLLAVAACITEDGGLAELDAEASRAALATLEERLERARPTLEPFPPEVRRQLLARAVADRAALMTPLRAEADAEAVEVDRQLAKRAAEEADQLAALLEAQRDRILRTLGGDQLTLDFGESVDEQRQAAQVAGDIRYLEGRLEAIEHELATEPAELRQLYDVRLRRFEPVGLVYLYPEMRL